MKILQDVVKKLPYRLIIKDQAYDVYGKPLPARNVAVFIERENEQASINDLSPLHDRIKQHPDYQKYLSE